jgi:AmiR/NasT family two-component response regulator
MAKTGHRITTHKEVRAAREDGGLAGAEAAVLTERDAQGEYLIRELQRLCLCVRHIWPVPDSLPSDADVIFCEYSPDLARLLPWVPGDAKSALVVLLPEDKPIEASVLTNSAPDGVLARPFTPNAVLASLIVARSQFRYEQRIRSKLDRLGDNLRSVRTVERAKAILMASRHIDSDEAYSFIRHQAMDRRVPVSSIATAIVSSHELLGPNLK